MRIELPAHLLSGHLLSACVLSLLGCGCSGLPADDLSATPQRPTRSAATSTTAVGSFELEAGATHEPDEFDGVSTVLKYGAGPGTEVYAAWSPYLRFEDLPGDDTDVGDLALGIRHRLVAETESRPSAAILAQVKLPTADESNGFSTGELDATFAGILNKSFDPFGVTAYYALDVLGDPRGGTNTGHNLALAAGAPLDGLGAANVGAFVEVAGVIVPEFDAEAAFTIIGLTYAPRPALVLDVAVLLGLNDDAADFQLLFGFTRNFGRPAGSAARHGQGAVAGP